MGLISGLKCDKCGSYCRPRAQTSLNFFSHHLNLLHHDFVKISFFGHDGSVVVVVAVVVVVVVIVVVAIHIVAPFVVDFMLCFFFFLINLVITVAVILIDPEHESVTNAVGSGTPRLPRVSPSPNIYQPFSPQSTISFIKSSSVLAQRLLQYIRCRDNFSRPKFGCALENLCITDILRK